MLECRPFLPGQGRTVERNQHRVGEAHSGPALHLEVREQNQTFLRGAGPEWRGRGGAGSDGGCWL